MLVFLLGKNSKDRHLGLWVVGLTINKGSGTSILLNNDSLVRIQFPNQVELNQEAVVKL